MAYGVSHNALKLNSHINLRLSILGYFSEPFVARFVHVFLENFDHDTHSVFEESVGDGLSLLFPSCICRHESECLVEHRSEELFDQFMLVYIRVVLVVEVTYHIGVLDISHDISKEVESDHSMLGSIVFRVTWLARFFTELFKGPDDNVWQHDFATFLLLDVLWL